MTCIWLQLTSFRIIYTASSRYNLSLYRILIELFLSSIWARYKIEPAVITQSSWNVRFYASYIMQTVFFFFASLTGDANRIAPNKCWPMEAGTFQAIRRGSNGQISVTRSNSNDPRYCTVTIQFFLWLDSMPHGFFFFSSGKEMRGESICLLAARAPNNIPTAAASTNKNAVIHSLLPVHSPPSFSLLT